MVYMQLYIYPVIVRQRVFRCPVATSAVAYASTLLLLLHIVGRLYFVSVQSTRLPLLVLGAVGLAVSFYEVLTLCFLTFSFLVNRKPWASLTLVS